MTQIEKNIPIPIRKGISSFKGITEVLKRTEVGDSFLWPTPTGNGLSSMAGAIGMEITVRKVDGGIRVWRLS
ncbi:MAG: hypothetical protein WCD70_14890 [Alphaproteobacteria bacterium]